MMPELMANLCLATAGYLRSSHSPQWLEGAEIKPDLATLPLVSR